MRGRVPLRNTPPLALPSPHLGERAAEHDEVRLGAEPIEVGALADAAPRDARRERLASKKWRGMIQYGMMCDTHGILLHCGRGAFGGGTP